MRSENLHSEVAIKVLELKDQNDFSSTSTMSQTQFYF